MNKENKAEVWMRGPIAGVPDLLQPVAHALLQVNEDAQKYTQNLQEDELWIRPHDLASVAFHLQHICGVIDRMFTYADNRGLSEAQFDALTREGKADEQIKLTALLTALDVQINEAIDRLRRVDPSTLSETRYLGRKRIPTTLIGLLFHAAEHAQRHIGQLLVTVRCVKE